MTPLAMHLTKQLVVPRKDRRDSWVDDKQREILRSKLSDVHCFEVSECRSLLTELLEVVVNQPPDKVRETISVCGFLPAPKTWVEWRMSRGTRVALHLEEIHDEPKNEAAIDANFFCEESGHYLGALTADHRIIMIPDSLRGLPARLRQFNDKVGQEMIFRQASLALILINSPRIIGRRQHMPHVGLQRQLTRGLAGGKFPLHAWTEIKLQVAKPIEIDDGEPHEAHLTGRRALHFVRKHIRIRLGQLEYVSAHWRGDPSIGMKRSRYTVTP